MVCNVLYLFFQSFYNLEFSYINAASAIFGVAAQPHMTVDIPEFSTDDAIQWLYKAERFFRVYSIPDDQKNVIGNVAVSVFFGLVLVLIKNVGYVEFGLHYVSPQFTVLKNLSSQWVGRNSTSQPSSSTIKTPFISGDVLGSDLVSGSVPTIKPR
ncbi:hypothetical protein VNO80_05604 [Phaseolus coccineus]|uniref:Uncharacterized protein n=1 Tax=Phaseolus coccineus TaxID=3886 RepID=A0AAN9RGV5_PHACN